MRAGKGIRIEGRQTVSLLGGLRDSALFEKIYGQMKDSGCRKEILIAQEGWLNQYFQEVSDLTWDILELEECPPLLFLEKGRNVPEGLFSSGKLGVRLVKTGDLHRAVFNYGHPVFCFSFDRKKFSEEKIEEEWLSMQAEALEWQEKPKSMELALDGTVKIL